VHSTEMQLRDQAPQNIPIPLKHLLPVGYGEQGNVKVRVSQYPGVFPFYTRLEDLSIFIGLPNMPGGVTAGGISASKTITSLVPAA